MATAAERQRKHREKQKALGRTRREFHVTAFEAQKIKELMKRMRK